MIGPVNPSPAPEAVKRTKRRVIARMRAALETARAFIEDELETRQNGGEDRYIIDAVEALAVVDRALASVQSPAPEGQTQSDAQGEKDSELARTDNSSFPDSQNGGSKAE